MRGVIPFQRAGATASASRPSPCGVIRIRTPRADLRLRIIAIILAIALIVTAIVLPLPIWMIIGHAVGAALLIGALILLWPNRDGVISQ